MKPNQNEGTKRWDMVTPQQGDDAATIQQQSPAGRTPSAAAPTDQDESDRLAYLDARSRGIPTRIIHRYLRWTPRHAARIKRRIDREKGILRELHPDPATQTHMPREHYVGNIRLGKREPEALWYPQFPEHHEMSCLQKSNIESRLEHMKADTQQKIADANRRLDELIAESNEGDKLIAGLKVACAKADAALTAEREEAYIASRNENESVVRTAAVAAKRLSEALAKLATVNGAIIRQKSVIEEINAAALANRDAEFLAEADKLRLRERLVKQATQFSELVYEISCLGGKHNVNAFGLLHPLPYWSYPTNPDTFYIDALYQLVGAAYRFQGVQWTLTYDKTPWEKAA